MSASLHLLFLRTACFVGCLLLFALSDVNGQSYSSLKKQANQYFESAQYRNALKYYRQGGFENSTDKKIRLHIGVCLYEINDVDGAINMFQPLINEGKTDPEVFLYMGKCFQSKLLFTDAGAYYKKFLQKCKKDHPLRPWVKDELIRCANGNRLKYADELAYVENAGTTINTQYDEFGVKTSPTTIDKIYFNSNRDDVARGKAPNGNVDMFSTALVNGRWTPPLPLPSNINSPGYDEVCGFSRDGQIVYFLSAVGQQFSIRTDTFTTEEGRVYQGIFSGPYTADGNGTDIVFFNDSICLFASDRTGGYGGYDLYISIQQHGNWTPGTNLGPVINTFYDERFPFLTMNGLTLFYSSNGLESVGGFDILTATFDPQSLSWSKPSNPGFPVNSPSDETYVALSPEGMTGYMTSNRKDGYGGEDIYRIFFKQPLLAHQQISAIPTFYQLLLSTGKDVKISNAPAEKPLEMKEYFISHLFLDNDAEILSPQNTKKLDLLANLMIIYPKINAELSCFELPSGQQTFNLYFSIKNAGKAADYLVGKGIARNRILLKGYGSSFPLIVAPAGTAVSPLYQKLNQRLEITLHKFEEEPVTIHLEEIQVPENLKDDRGAKFTLLRHQLYYSVQIASITQILQNPELESVEEMFIEVDNTQGNYLYMTGFSPTFKEAEMVMRRMIELGFPDAFIIPYIDGLRVPKLSVADLVETYPDLLLYLNYIKK